VVLVDSSVYIQLLRQRCDPVAELLGRYDLSELVICDVVRCEVLRGIVEPLARNDLAQLFDRLIHVATDHRVWRETEEMAWRLDRAGKILPLADLIIASCALHAGAAVVTHDRHFELIPNLALAEWT
jgi:predicted nucleic acid-binding protein